MRGDSIFRFFKKFAILFVILFTLVASVFISCSFFKSVSKVSYDVPKVKISRIDEDFNENNNVWKLEIPCINLEADIEDGTDSDVLDRAIGHFNQTGYVDGNIALAAHNRGYPVNYFANLKQLKIGDEINYFYKGNQIKFGVTDIKVIKDTDVEVLESTEDSVITLITCVENEPQYRRCIVGKRI